MRYRCTHSKFCVCFKFVFFCVWKIWFSQAWFFEVSPLNLEVFVEKESIKMGFPYNCWGFPFNFQWLMIPNQAHVIFGFSIVNHPVIENPPCLRKASNQVQGVMFQNMIPEPKKKPTRGAGRHAIAWRAITGIAGWVYDYCAVLFAICEWDGELRTQLAVPFRALERVNMIDSSLKIRRVLCFNRFRYLETSLPHGTSWYVTLFYMANLSKSPPFVFRNCTWSTESTDGSWGSPPPSKIELAQITIWLFNIAMENHHFIAR